MDGRLNKLRFRAWRRGFREADLILGPFADTHLPSLTPPQLDEFETLLDQPDHDLYGWIIGQSPAPQPFDGTAPDNLVNSPVRGPKPVPSVRCSATLPHPHRQETSCPPTRPPPTEPSAT